MSASAELVLGAVHGPAGLSPAAAAVRGNLGASIKPVLTGRRKPSESKQSWFCTAPRAWPKQAHLCSQATQICWLTLDGFDGQVPCHQVLTCIWRLGPRCLQSCGPKTLPQSPCLIRNLEFSLGGSHPSWDPKSGGSLPAVCAPAGLPDSLQRAACRVSGSTGSHRGATQPPSCKSILQQGQWCRGLHSTPHGSGALCWKALVARTPGPPGPKLLPWRARSFCSVHAEKAVPGDRPSLGRGIICGGRRAPPLGHSAPSYSHSPSATSKITRHPASPDGDAVCGT